MNFVNCVESLMRIHDKYVNHVMQVLNLEFLDEFVSFIHLLIKIKMIMNVSKYKKE